MENKKKAILAVSFGTSFHETREKTIDRIEADLAAAYPEYTLYRAWTSKMIITKLKKRDGIVIPTVAEAVEQMISDGVQELIVQPTHIINGIENDLMKEDVLARKEAFEKIAFGDPLLTTTEDNVAVLQAVMSEFPALAEDEALVLWDMELPITPIPFTRPWIIPLRIWDIPEPFSEPWRLIRPWNP